MKRFPLIKVAGNAFDRGYEIGKQAKQQISHNIETYQYLFKKNGNIDWDEAKERAKQYVPWIQNYDSEIMEEIKGISEGSGFELLEIVALNARSEIILHPDGCTSLAATPVVNKEQYTLLGQNWDWGSQLREGVVLLDIDQTPRPRIFMATEAGIVGKIGMNDQGLGVCLNLLGTAEEASYGVPIHVVLRGILNSMNLNQAIGQIGRMPRGVAANFLMAHGEGEAINVEMSPTDYDVLYPESGYYAHANHFIGPRKVNVKDTARNIYPDTHLRQGVADKLLAASEEINKETFMKVFTNHVGYPDSICRHGEQFPVDLGRPEASDTVFSIIMNLTEQTLDISVGQACVAPYSSYSFE